MMCKEMGGHFLSSIVLTTSTEKGFMTESDRKSPTFTFWLLHKQHETGTSHGAQADGVASASTELCRVRVTVSIQQPHLEASRFENDDGS